MRPTLAVLLASVAAAADVKEYVALISGQSVTWTEVAYPSNFTATRASEISITAVNGDPEELGAWAPSFQLGGQPELTGRVRGNKMYASLNTGTAPTQGVPGGCCADTLRIWDRESGRSSDIDINGGELVVAIGLRDDTFLTSTPADQF